MKLTTKGRYAVTAMLDLGLYAEEAKPVCLSDISSRHHISLSYLEQLFSKLKKHGLVRSVRGPGGGYLLSASPDQLSLASIVDAVDETIDATLCNGSENCRDGKPCITHQLWTDLGKQIHEYLSQMSLQKVIDEHLEAQERLQAQQAKQTENQTQSLILNNTNSNEQGLRGQITL